MDKKEFKAFCQKEFKAVSYTHLFFNTEPLRFFVIVSVKHFEYPVYACLLYTSFEDILYVYYLLKTHMFQHRIALCTQKEIIYSL